MSGYRFCRTDDIALLVEALNRCWAPYEPDQPPMTPAVFKRWIRNLQVWCSSCMVAFADGHPVGVLIGAKRAGGTLVHRLAVHPEHARQGHGRHMLASLGSKLAILGPPRLVAEVPETLAPACGLFETAGYLEEVVLTDYVLEDDARVFPESCSGARAASLLIPVTVDDLEANGLVAADDQRVCWERALDTLRARRDEIAGLAVASDERIESCVLYAPGQPGQAGEILSLRSFVGDGDGARLGYVLGRLRATVPGPLRLAKVHPEEIPPACMEGLGFRPAGSHRRYVGRAASA